MNIGFDLDKVLINYPPFIPATFIDKLYKKKDNGILLYRIPSKPEQALRLLTHFSPFRPPIKENLEFLKELAAKNTHKHYLISGRFGFLKDKTHQLIQKHNLDRVFEDMFFNFHDKQPHEFKDEIIKKYNIEKYVDDDRSLLEYLAEQNPHVLFFWLNSKIQKKLESNLIAITHLSQMFSK